MTLPFLTPLDADQQRAAGLGSAWPLAVLDRVRYAEIDAQKHVNNVAYMTWFEGLRARYCQMWGISQFTESDPLVVIRYADINYLREMSMGEDYVLTARTVSFRNTSFTQHYGLFVNGELRTTGSAVAVLLRPGGAGKMPLPDSLRQRFIEVDGAETL